MLCEAALLAEHRRSGRPDRDELLRPLRGACLERFPAPGAGRRQALLRALDEEATALLGE